VQPLYPCIIKDGDVNKIRCCSHMQRILPYHTPNIIVYMFYQAC